jgi:hypothetical protein
MANHSQASLDQPELRLGNVTRSSTWLIVGVVAVFGAHVVLPFLFMSASRSRYMSGWIVSLASAIDPAIWMIVTPFLLACIGYDYVFRHCRIAGFSSRRIVRWPIAFVIAFFSLWAGMTWIFNTFGS